MFDLKKDETKALRVVIGGIVFMALLAIAGVVVMVMLATRGCSLVERVVEQKVLSDGK